MIVLVSNIKSMFWLNPQLLSEPLVVTIAERTNRTPAQVLLQWAIQQDLGMYNMLSCLYNSIITSYSLCMEYTRDHPNKAMRQASCPIFFRSAERHLRIVEILPQFMTVV